MLRQDITKNTEQIAFKPINTPAQGEEFLLKPMNCPHITAKFTTPRRGATEICRLRLAEFGTVYQL
jgi:threonyl-tRNA synthetase